MQLAHNGQAGPPMDVEWTHDSGPCDCEFSVLVARFSARTFRSVMRDMKTAVRRPRSRAWPNTWRKMTLLRAAMRPDQSPATMNGCGQEYAKSATWTKTPT